MQFFTASRLGRLQQDLGLRDDTRVFLQIMTGGATGAYVWDLETGNTFLLIQAQETVRGQNRVPDRVTQILTASDEELKDRWRATEDWDDDRESLMSELAARGISVQELEEIEKSAGAY
jgi:hypothetical protein